VFSHDGSPDQNSPVYEANMAIEEFTSRERSSIHRMLTLLNSSLQSVVLKLEQLAASDVLTPQYLEGLRKRSREVEAELKSIFNF
jgi:hypothetical protein